MPQPRAGETQSEFLERCIPFVLDEGAAESNEQAVAVCHSYWEQAQEEKAMMTLEEYWVEGHWAEEVKAATEEEKEAQQKRAKKYGIAAKEKGHVTKPSKYADVPEGSFGDPTNFKFPADAEHAKPALTYFNHPNMREKGGYSSKEWGIMGKRLAKRISRHLDGSYEYKDGKLQKKETKAVFQTPDGIKEASLDEDIRHIRDAWYEKFTPNSGDVSEADRYGWVSEVFADKVIVEEKDGYWAYFYTTHDDRVIWGERVAVERVYVEKKAPAQMGGIVPDTMTYSASNTTLVPSDSSTTPNITIVGDSTPPPPEPAAKDGANLEEMKSLDLTRAIKLVDETPEHFLVGGYGHVWGNKQLKDLAGDYFTPDTDLLPELVPTKLVFYDHALSKGPDKKNFDDPIGVAPEDMTRVDDVGKWVQAQIDKRAKWVDAVMELIERGILAWSSGAVPHLVKRAKDGWLERWPVAEYTPTTTPCEPRSTDISRLKTAYAAAGLKWLPDNFEPENLGTVSDDDLVTRLAVEHAIEQLRTVDGVL